MKRHEIEEHLIATADMLTLIANTSKNELGEHDMRDLIAIEESITDLIQWLRYEKNHRDSEEN